MKFRITEFKISAGMEQEKYLNQWFDFEKVKDGFFHLFGRPGCVVEVDIRSIVDDYFSLESMPTFKPLDGIDILFFVQSGFAGDYIIRPAKLKGDKIVVELKDAQCYNLEKIKGEIVEMIKESPEYKIAELEKENKNLKEKIDKAYDEYVELKNSINEVIHLLREGHKEIDFEYSDSYREAYRILKNLNM